jgi:hypothetical protein
MKKSVLLWCAIIVIMFSSCETTKEISINEDGSGMLVSTNDMGQLLGLAKMSPGAEGMDKLTENPIDTTVDIAGKLESFSELTPEEKDLIKNGKLGLTLDLKNDKALIKVSLPFSDPSTILRLDKLSSKVGMDVVKEQMSQADDKLPEGMKLPEGSFDDYFTSSYSKGVLERKLNKEKYAKLGEDQEMQAIKEMAGLGMGNTKIIFTLPRPARKAEGKSLTVSDDKKTITIMTSADEFFSDATSLEFRIEY